jgi:Zn-finger nucleic acid-binding protein
MSETKNKLDKTLKDYTCKACGYVHANWFVQNQVMKQCYRCRRKWTNSGDLETAVENRLRVLEA